MKSQNLFCLRVIGFVVLGFFSVRLLALGDLKQEAESLNPPMQRAKAINSTKEVGHARALMPAKDSISVKEMELAIEVAISEASPLVAWHSIGKEVVAEIPNPMIDPQRFLIAATESVKLREGRRLTEEQFLEMSKEQGVVILDARSRDRYEEVHIQGAMSLPFTDISFDSLAKQLPNKETKILIYCNNNFNGNLPELQSKLAGTSLNLSTFATLYEYGYRNVYELGPALEINQTKIPFAGTNAKMLTTK